MQQRNVVSSGRPTGTDGSDFNYRMVVETRYQKVAEGKNHLYALILTQAVVQFIGVVYTFLVTTKGDGPSVIAISSIAIASVSLILGDLGRRRSRVTLLKGYMVGSSIAALLSIACVAMGSVTLEVFLNPSNWQKHKFEILEVAHTAIGFLVQICTVNTVTSLISNMSPKRTS